MEEQSDAPGVTMLRAEAPRAGQPTAPRSDFDAPAEARRILRAARAATLATLTAQGHPFATLVTVATDIDGTPILLLSRLSAHTRHLLADPRASLLQSETGKGDPLAHPRLTLVGRAAECKAGLERDRLRRRYLARNPKAALYADFGDFSFWRLTVEAAHLNGGFARAAELAAADVLTPIAAASDLTAAEEGAIAHMNTDHAEAVGLYATRLANRRPGPWTLTGVDPGGMDLALGSEIARVAFEHPVTTAAELRSTLAAMAKRARALPDPARDGDRGAPS